MIKLQKRIGEDNFRYDPSLVLYLPFYELDGDSFASRDAYRHVATVIGAVWGLQGRSFDPVDDRITIRLTDTSLAFTTKDFTVIGWLKLNATNTLANVFCWVPSVGNNVQFCLNDGTGNIGIYGETGWVFQKAWAPAVEQFYHCAFTRASNVWRAFINSIQQGTDTTDTRTLGGPVSGAYTIGNEPGNTQPLNGLFGELLIHLDKGFTPLEVQGSYEDSKWRYR